MRSFSARLDILPPAQRRLWPELADAPPDWVLYGGTALALRTGSRQSEDFDFFTNAPVDAHQLAQHIAFLHKAELIQAAPGTATFLVDRGGPVKVSIFGVGIGRVADPSRADDIGLSLASLVDIAAQKVRVIQVRAERKDYLDLLTLLQNGITLDRALGAAKAIYPEFAPMVSLKALSYFSDGDLDSLPASARATLIAAAGEVDTVQVVPLASAQLIG